MKWFYNLKIGTKILLSFLISIIFTGAIGYIGITNINKMNKIDTELYVSNTKPITQLNTIQVELQRNRVIVRNIIIENDINKNRENVKLIENSDKQIDQKMNELKDSMKTQDVKDEYNNLRAAIDKYIPIRNTIIELGSQNKNEEAISLINGEGTSRLKAVDDSITKLVTLKEAQAKDKSDSNTQIANSSSITMVIIIILGIVISLGFGIVISMIISRPIKRLTEVANKISKGDIDVVIDVETKDEVGDCETAFKTMVDNIREQAQIIDKISKGDLEVKVNIKSEKDILNKGLQTMVSTVTALATDINMLANAAQEGKLDTRGNAEAFAGEWGKLVSGVNKLIETVVKPIKEVAATMGEVSQGNLDVSVKGSYKGEFEELAKSVNTTVERLKRVIKEISEILGEISNGNIAIENIKKFNGNFESVSVSLNTIVDSLNSVFSEINTAAEQVAIGSSQVSGGSQALSQGATEQASAIEELTSSITEIAAQTKENAANANQANELSLKVKANAEQGNMHMSEMLKAMGEINESSANISKIIKVIDEIAFQTNILALNAAVEAARAGQHGKGFAVVAEEVRNLAARSANAAKETTALIEGSIKKAEKGTEIANDTAKALYEIVDGVSKAAVLVSEIAASSSEQASGISQINVGIEQVSQVVQTNSATAEESAAASEELSSQAVLLKDMVRRFKLKTSNMSLVHKETKMFNKQFHNIEEDLSFKEAAITLSKPKIALSDKEFGKY